METKYMVSVILATAYGVFVEALLLAASGIPVNESFVIIALGFQLIAFPVLAWQAEHRIKQKKRIFFREVECGNARF